jgi:NADH-quinone oxidoreductase subunit M
MAMVVAGKLGLYSIFRFNLGLFPAQARAIAPLMIVVAVVGLLYGALVALAQSDVKRLIAYSILSNLSFCTLGIFCFSLAGLNGAVFQTINEGLTGSALLVLVSLLYERYGTSDMTLYGGLAGRLPMLATLYVITSLALVGLPLFNGFVGEFLVLSGGFPLHPRWVATATIGVILSATYILSMVQRIFYGQQSSLVVNRPAPDLNAREHIMLWSMAVVMLAMGVASPYWIRGIEGGVSGLADHPGATVGTDGITMPGQSAAAVAVSTEKQ